MLLDNSLVILAYKKDNNIYAGTYAWATQVGYDNIVCLLGSQSVTAKKLNVGDIIGLNVMKDTQKELAIKVGNSHSNVINKLEGVKYHEEDTAIIIDDSKTMMKCVVKKIMHLEGIEEDSLVYLETLSHKETEGKWLHFSDC